jgi:molybdopterin-guanine dinucleotide biosynthesis protein A
VRGRGAVVTGTLRGGTLAAGRSLRLEPDGRTVRVRGIQVHGRPVARVDGGGRAALNLAGIETAELRRGGVLAGGPDVVATDRLLVAIRPPTTRTTAFRRLRHGATVRLHVATDQVDARVGRGRTDGVALDGEEVVRLSLARPIAAAWGDRFVLRWPSPASTAAGGRILDATPPFGVARRRAIPARLGALAEADGPGAVLAALVALHGVLPADRVASVLAAHGHDPAAVQLEALLAGSVGVVDALEVDAVGRVLVARDIVTAVELDAFERVAAHHEVKPLSLGMALSELRPLLARAIRRRASLTPGDAGSLATELVDQIVTSGRLARSGGLVRDPARSAGIPELVLAAMGRLEASLALPCPAVVHRGNPRCRLPARRSPGAGVERTYRPPRYRHRIRRRDLPPIRGARPGDGRDRSGGSGSVPRRDGDESQVQPRAARGARPSGAPAANAGRPPPRAACPAGPMSDFLRGRVTGIVLAGGRAHRFGRDKLREPIEGRPLLLSAVGAIATVCSEVVLVLAPDAVEPAIPTDVVPAVRFTHDPERHGGPLVGMLAGLDAASEPLALVVGGDMPWLQSAVLRLLIEEAERLAARAVVLRFDGRDQQLPIALRVEDARVIARRLIGDGSRRIDALLDELRSDGIEETRWRGLDPDGWTLRDVDRPGDLDAGPSQDT